jgi:type II secretory pathway pseudopilin PulG
MGIGRQNHIMKTSAGFSLIEILVAVSIMIIMALGFSSLVFNQAKATRGLTEKQAAQDVNRSIMNALMNAKICSQLVKPTNLVNPGALPANISGVSETNPYRIPLKDVFLSEDLTIKLTAGSTTPPSPISPTLTINPPDATPPGFELLVTSPTSALLNVNFDRSKLVIPIHNLSYRISLASNGSLTSFKINGCSGAAGSKMAATAIFPPYQPDGSPGTPGTFIWTVPAGVSSIRVTVVGGGGGGQGTLPTVAPGKGDGFWKGTGSVGLGGTGGASVVAVMAVTEGTSFNITVGAGGKGGAPGNVGQPGGASSFDSYIIAPGGQNAGGPGMPGGGIAPVASLPFVIGPFGGTHMPTISGAVNVLVQNMETQGTPGLAFNCGNVLGGAGGLGLGGSGGNTTAAESDGRTPAGFGGGGSGGGSSCGNPPRAGGDGAPGAVLIEW